VLSAFACCSHTRCDGAWVSSSWSALIRDVGPVVAACRTSMLPRASWRSDTRGGPSTVPVASLALSAHSIPAWSPVLGPSATASHPISVLLAALGINRSLRSIRYRHRSARLGWRITTCHRSPHGLTLVFVRCRGQARGPHHPGTGPPRQGQARRLPGPSPRRTNAAHDVQASGQGINA
jgi:hypothetical protein